MSGWEGFFPYYAGYPETFAEAILKSAGLRKGATVLDPWNGSGTTTYTAAKLGYATIGIDLNPVMVLVAKARLLPASEADSIEPLGAEILTGAAELTDISTDDPICAWFDARAMRMIRALEVSIRTRLVGDLPTRQHGINLDDLPNIAAAFYVALFATCRDFTKRFRSSNPTWIRKAKLDSDKASVSSLQLAAAFRAHLSTLAAALADRANGRSFVAGPSLIKLADSTADLGSRTADFILTSPPYCTRIDYPTATSVELAVMNPLLPVAVKDLRRRMIGSTRVPLYRLAIRESWGPICCRFLNAVSQHHSKASSGYYLKTHLDYFDKLDRSIRSISKCLKLHCGAILVVQDSYYKDIHNDLPAIVNEMAKSHGLALRHRKNFQLKTTLAGRHPHTKAYRQASGAVEAVLCFEKTHDMQDNSSNGAVH